MAKAKTEKAPKEPKAPKTPKTDGKKKVVVLKKNMDISECLEAVAKIKEFVAEGKEETHRELKMAIESLGSSLKSVESWLSNVAEVISAIKKQEAKAEKVKGKKE